MFAVIFSGRLRCQPIVFLATVLLAVPAFSADWRPLDPEELALKQSKTDAKADAEALFRDVRIENDIHGANQNVRTEYVRMKIFTDRGREKFSNVKIEYYGKTTISDVSARTIHPDGTVIDVKRDAIFDKLEAKKGGLKVKTVSFALPSVEPGSIIEYRWKKNMGELNGFYQPYIPLDIQTDYPIDEVSFHFKPFSREVTNAQSRFIPFRCTPEKMTQDSMGFSTIIVRDVPAYHDEPFSAPDLSDKAWILIYYESIDQSNREKYWNSYGHERYGQVKERIKVTGEIKQAAAEVVSQGKTDDEKLALLADYCGKTVKNIGGPDVTTEQREAYKPNNNTGDAFRQKLGDAQDIDLVFVALAQAAGYDARLALIADRRDFMFNPQVMNGYFVNNFDAAVMVNDKWKFYDVGDPWSPPGTLTWREQGVYALIPDSKKSEWVQTPLLNSDDTKRQRLAMLQLTPEGDLDGDIRELLWGNESIDWRIQHGRQNQAEREDWLREQLKERFSDFEVSNIRIVAAPDASKPVGINYHLHVRSYAQRTGRRIFIRPGFFTAGQAAFFTDATRTNIIYFPYPWSEQDSVEIKLPEGFELDHADAPPNFNFPPVGQYAIKLSIATNPATLIYRRTLTFGNDQLLSLDPKNYKAVKTVFDQIHTNDEHMLTLKQAEAQPAAVQPTGQVRRHDASLFSGYRSHVCAARRVGI